MPIDPEKRAETSRINGARSNGPNTPEGKEKCARAAAQNGQPRAVEMLTRHRVPE